MNLSDALLNLYIIFPIFHDFVILWLKFLSYFVWSDEFYIFE